VPNYVPGTGNPNSLLAIVADAPSEDDDESKMPFSGPGGMMLDNILKGAGIHRGELWITHLSKFRPPGDNFNKLEDIGVDLEESIKQLGEELKTVGCTTILALGEQTLKATTGLPLLAKRRGSILRSRWEGIKVIPSFHPISLLHQHGTYPGVSYFWKSVMALDFARARQESYTTELNLPDRTLMVCKSSYELRNFLQRHADKDLWALDIETRKCIPVCLALAPSRFESMSIPLLEPNSWHESRSGLNNDAEMTEIWRLLIEFFEKPGLKIIGQNFKFDHEKLLKPCGFPVPEPFADTMLAMHSINPELPKSLDFIASIYTREPYYKDEGREFDLRKHPIERFFLYNAKDSAVTFEAWEELEKELIELGLLDWFHNFVMPLHGLYMHIESNGFKLDEARRAELKVKYSVKLKEAFKEFEELTGYRPVENAADQKRILKENKKAGTEPSNLVNLASTTQLPELLYGVLGYPKRKGSDEDTLVALIGNHCSKDPSKARVLELVLDIRKYQKTLGTYLEVVPDYDGRVRTSYKICGTETGRTSTVMIDAPLRPDKMGTAFQTLTKHGDIGPEVREMYVPGY
jgi:uracil-DNA glycosylase family 4